MFQVFRVAATQDTRPGCSVFIFNQYENKFFYVGSFLSKVDALCSPSSTSPVVCCTAIVVMATLVSPQPENNGLSGR